MTEMLCDADAVAGLAEARRPGSRLGQPGVAVQRAGREFSMTRILPACVETAFAAWTDAVCAQAWWGPQGFTATQVSVDATPGGRLLLAGQCARGRSGRIAGRFEEVVAPDWLVFSDECRFDDGAPVFASITTVTLRPVESAAGDATRLHLHCELRHGNTHAAVIAAGLWSTSLDRLHSFLSRMHARPDFA